MPGLLLIISHSPRHTRTTEKGTLVPTDENFSVAKAIVVRIPPPVLPLASFPKREAVYVDAVFIVAQAVCTEFYLVALGVVNEDLLLSPLLPGFS